MARYKNKISPLFTALFIILILYASLLILLLVWGALTSIRDNLGFIEDPFSFVGGIKLDNYLQVFVHFKKSVYLEGGGYRDVYLEEMFLNSIVYSLGCALCQTFVTCAVAYVAAKFDFKICKLLYTIVIVIMVLPIVGSLPAEINMAKMLNIYGTMWGMFIMKASFLGPYFLVFAAIFKGVPKDYTEAGYIDGANDFNIFFSVMFPMVKDTFMTILLILFIGFWNDYSVPLVYLPDYPPLALGLYLFNSSTDNAISSVPIKMAGCFMVTIPILVVFIVFQDKLMGNLSMGGLKE